MQVTKRVIGAQLKKSRYTVANIYEFHETLITLAHLANPDDPFQDAVPCWQPRERYNFWCKPCGGVVHGNPMDHLHD